MSIEDRQTRFSQRLDKMRREHALEVSRPALNPALPVEEQAAAYDAWLEQRIALWRGEEPPEAGSSRREPPRPIPEPARGEHAARVETWAGEVDRAALTEFGLERFPRPGVFGQPARLFGRAEEFLSALADGLELCAAERRNSSDPSSTTSIFFSPRW